MRLTGSLATVLCLLVATSAVAGRGAQGWTEAKAERVAKREATVRLPGDLLDRVSPARRLEERSRPNVASVTVGTSRPRTTRDAGGRTLDP